MGVKEGVVDQVDKRTAEVRYGVLARRTPFWDWMTGRGLRHMWTTKVQAANRTNVIVDQLRRVPIDVLFLEDEVSGEVLTAASQSELKAMVWYRGRSPRAPPAGWSIQTITLQHSELGGVTNGRHHVRIATRDEIGEITPRAPVGTNATLNQILDPTLSGKPCDGEDSMEGGDNTPSGLLDWSRRHSAVVAPTVYSSSPYVERCLSVRELLSALDAPTEKVKAATGPELSQWARELTLPFKVRREVCEWLYILVTQRDPNESSTMGKAKRPAEGPFGPEAKRLRRAEENPVEKTCSIPPQGVSSNDPQSQQKAAKHDDAEVPVALWNDRVRQGSRLTLTDQELDLIRNLLLTYWKKLVARNFASWCWRTREEAKLKNEEADREQIRSGAAALAFAAEATWWDWPKGSAPFFWNWPPAYQRLMSEGLPPRFTGEPPRCCKPQRLNKDPKVHDWEKNKVEKARRKSFIGPSREPIDSLMSFFSVPKVTVFHEETGQEEVLDIRMVYNGSSCGLNAVLWAPWFALPTGEQMTRTLDVGYWGADNDYGEMFYNFWLHKDLRRYSGVDLTVHFPEELDGQDTLWEVWTRPAMGLKPSPYQSVQGSLVTKRIALGDPKDESNVYRWNTLSLNLPGNLDYSPGAPWVAKRQQDGSIAADVHSYVDDERVTGPTREETWQGSSKLAKLRAHLGLQDAARKRREPSQEPGPWAGVVAHSKPGEPVYKLVTQLRWDKARRLLGEIRDLFESGKSKDDQVWLPRDRLESARGFLVYVARTYTAMNPYLKGLHLTIDSWRENRDEDGWRVTSEADTRLDSGPAPEAAPPRVKAVPRLAGDLRALEELTAFEHPPKVRVRPADSAAVIFTFGDASGAGFGQSYWVLGKEDVDVFYGIWDSWAAAHSSNWREFYNQVLGLERGVADGSIPRGTEVFMFTNNFVTERAYFKGTSKNKDLFELVLRLRKLEMKGELFIHLIWVAGTRMIEQGTDGVSRGDLASGVMSGRSMLQYVPLNLGVDARSPALVAWFTEASGGTWVTLKPHEWYHKAHVEDGNYVWCPPPAIADIALEQLCETRHTRPWNGHIFLCPALMTARWRKRLAKVSDAMFTVPVGSFLWGAEMHEPVVVSLICPLLPSRPWQVRNTDLVDELRNQVSGVWSDDLNREWTGLRQLWTGAREWTVV